jgi:hypothetical protein
LKIDEVTFLPANSATIGSPYNLPMSSDISTLSVGVTEGLSIGHSPLVTPTVTSFCSESPKTPVCSNFDLEIDSEENWTKLCRHRRGKHPRKIVYL